VSNPSAMDAISGIYYRQYFRDDLPEMFFGLLLDNAVGGEEYDGADDNSYFNKPLNLCYSWIQMGSHRRRSCAGRIRGCLSGKSRYSQ